MTPDDLIVAVEDLVSPSFLIAAGLKLKSDLVLTFELCELFGDIHQPDTR